MISWAGTGDLVWTFIRKVSKSYSIRCSKGPCWMWGRDNSVEGNDATNHWCSSKMKINVSGFFCCLEIRHLFSHARVETRTHTHAQNKMHFFIMCTKKRNTSLKLKITFLHLKFKVQVNAKIKHINSLSLFQQVKYSN